MTEAVLTIRLDSPICACSDRRRAWSIEFRYYHGWLRVTCKDCRAMKDVDYDGITASVVEPQVPPVSKGVYR